MVFCVQMGPKPLSQSIPQASWGGRGQRTEFGVWPPCPHISPFPHPQEFTWSLNRPPTPPVPPPRSGLCNEGQGHRTLPGENLT